MTNEQLRDFGRRYTAAWCSRQPALVAEFFETDGSLTINDGAPSAGRAAITQAAAGFMTDFPDLVVCMDDVSTVGAGAIYRWTLTGTHAGRRVRISGFEEWTFGAAGLVARSLGHFDADDYERQLTA